MLFWNRWLGQECRWLPTVTLVPLLYLFGQVTIQLIAPMLAIPLELRGTAGLLISFVLLLAILPSWVCQRWQTLHPWRALGLCEPQSFIYAIGKLLRGLTWAALLLLCVTIPLLLGGWASWLGDLNSTEIFNAVALLLVVGLAEELLFRGWLLGELIVLLGPRQGGLAQAVIFSLVHIRLEAGVIETAPILLGLFILGLVLLCRKQLDHGSLWGCIGLHGGLVGGWFTIEMGLLQLSPSSPSWLIGPSVTDINPIGSLTSLLCLTIVLRIQRVALAKAPLPSSGACSA
ncbi:CPBP family intramembrane metalloprotease [cyanobiont of Ornithocercus magnificus]|nr:CPBP family intramembrane metalloprotease [cyanobiont of Ornithocercus magnificus]